MQKDVIYIDVEDDITAIIGKVKDSGSKIVALVPPKRIGAIQSAVNLKLVHRAAEQADKRLVIISNNSALMALAGSAGIPVAKNLQSKPEIAEISALDIDDGEDIIDGSELPVGEHAKQSEKTTPAEVAEDTKDASSAAATGVAATTASGAAAKASALRSRAKVPNFNDARKKIFLIGGGALALLVFLVWALFFAPHARIIITAKTSDSALNSRVTLGPSLATDLKAGTLKAETKTIKKDSSVAFTATGKKDVGEKSTGQVKFSTGQISALGTTIPAGTVLTSQSGATYVTDTSVTMTISNYTGTVSGITASQSGAKYNGATGPVSGAPSGISATISQATTGGTDKTITIVEQGDVDAVSDQVGKQSEADAVKNELKNQFKGDYIVLDSTFKTDKGELKATPAVGQESTDGKGTYGGSVTYSLTAVPRAEAGKYLDAYFAQQIDGKSNQKVYENGLKGVNFTNLSGIENGFSSNISTNGKIGPKIDEAKLKEFAKGKEYGEIQSEVQSVEGVESADVKFSPFWVSSAPNDTGRIKVEFKVNGQ
jgi:hypothetical protein